MFNFFSSFGQTFFISLFVPFWVETFKISNATFGSMYATVTIISAFLLSLSGKYIDHMPLKKFGSIVFIALVISVVFMSQSYHWPVLMASLLLVRFFGQGLMIHTSSTGIAKHFENNRGKALGFTALGHPAGQFALPLLILPLIALVGWRSGLVYMVVAASVLVLPALWAITPVTGLEPDIAKKTNIIDKSSFNYFASSKFWIMAANIFLVPFICTAVFLYQYTIGQSKGWDASWVAFSFTFYAVFNALALLLSGNLVDRYSGLKLFPLYLIPTLLALVFISFIDNKWIFPLFYALLGISSGLGSTVKTAMQVEIYGTGNLGKIRSYFSTLLVLSTALGPPVFGYFFDHYYSFNAIMLIFGTIVLFVIGLSFSLTKNQKVI
ncbi:MAG: MFS transporter [Bacteroidales bacterium]|nr:MFS transporter [Bacteroidales bacterium]